MTIIKRVLLIVIHLLSENDIYIVKKKKMKIIGI